MTADTLSPAHRITVGRVTATIWEFCLPDGSRKYAVNVKNEADTVERTLRERKTRYREDRRDAVRALRAAKQWMHQQALT